jgi:phosphoglycerate kinase
LDKLTVRDLDLRGRKVLVRVDFNVPLRDGEVEDDQRVRAALPTLELALDRGAALIVMSHLGRPKGQRKPELSLRPVAACLARHLGRDVAFAGDCVGEEAERLARELRPGGVLLLENLRFHPGEERPSSEPDFAERLAALGERYVNDAFGTAHRAHASMVAVAEHFTEPAAGLLMAKELEFFGRLAASPERPYVAVLGGAKASDKIPVVEKLLGKVDALLVGGAMAYTFLRAAGASVGASRIEEDRLEAARDTLARAKSRRVDVLLPVDHVCGRAFAADTEWRVVASRDIPGGWLGLDIGPATAEAFAARIRDAATVVWNGPMGVFEWEPFAAGTLAVARACAESRGLTIVGGGDSAAAAARSGYADRFDHISTGGGASLELLEGKTLPGVAALSDRRS